MSKLIEWFRSVLNWFKTRSETERPDSEQLGNEGADAPALPEPEAPKVEEPVAHPEPPKPAPEKSEPAPAAAPALSKIYKIDWKKAYNKKELWFPNAKKVEKITSRGKYPKGYPEGMIVHFNAGRNDPVNTMASGRKNGYLYSALGRDGLLVQSNALNEWGWHAGTSAWTDPAGKKFTSVHTRLHGLEISSAGMVKPDGKGAFDTWFKTKLTAAEVREVPKAKDNQIKGFYHKYEAVQEEALIEYILWLKVNNPSVFSFDMVVGHDEVCQPKGRKNDPGGALSMSMPEFRALLKKRYAELKLD